jgi:hypothetical protein
MPESPDVLLHIHALNPPCSWAAGKRRARRPSVAAGFVDPPLSVVEARAIVALGGSERIVFEAVATTKRESNQGLGAQHVSPSG